MDGKTWVMLKMKCTMKENWSAQDFPFDKQHLKVQIENSILHNTVLIFDPDLKRSKFDDEEAIDGWVISNFRVGVHEVFIPLASVIQGRDMTSKHFLSLPSTWTSSAMRGGYS